MLPDAGSVLGIDVGWSLNAASSAICRLDWDETAVRWTVRHFTGQPVARAAALAEVGGAGQLLAVALDGSLRGDLAVIDRYRAAERALSVQVLAGRISQPGSSRSPVGRLLNHHANEFARLLVARGGITEATHRHAIHRLAIVEAFPTSFLGLMLEAPEKGLRLKRSDRYYVALAEDGTLGRLLTHHLPGRRVPDFSAVTNHDERAALVCALTALGVVGQDYVTVGDEDGWIILPPRSFIGAWAGDIVQSWNHGMAKRLT